MIITTEARLSKKFTDHIDRYIKTTILEHLNEIVRELDPKKNYILIIPSDISLEDARKSFAPFVGKVNMVVLQADDVKILELS